MTTDTTYRAAYIGGLVLTAPEHAELDDDALIAEALAEAERAGMIGDEAPRMPAEMLAEKIQIGEWQA